MQGTDTPIWHQLLATFERAADLAEQTHVARLLSEVRRRQRGAQAGRLSSHYGTPGEARGKK